jgi:Effector-associated domain 1
MPTGHQADIGSWARLRAEVKRMSTNHEPAFYAQVVDELANVFHTEIAAHELLERVRFPRGRVPSFREPAAFWQEIAQRLEAGILGKGSGLGRLIRAAAEMYCGNEIFQSWLRTNSLVSENRRGNGGVTILLTTSLDLHQVVDLARELARDRRLSSTLDLLFASGEHVALYLSESDAEGALELSDLLAERLNGHLRRRPIVAGDLIRDHLIDRLFVEVPDSSPSELSRTPSASAALLSGHAGQLNGA